MRRFLIIVALVSVCLGGAWLGRVPLAQALADWATEAYAPLPVSFEIRQIDHNRVVVAEIQAGSEAPVRIGSVTIGYTIAGLLKNAIASIEIDDVSLPVAITSDGVRVGDLSSSEEQDQELTVWPDWTVGAISVSGINADIDFQNTIAVSLQADIGTNWEIDLQFMQAMLLQGGPAAPVGLLSTGLVDAAGNLRVSIPQDVTVDIGIPGLSGIRAAGSADFKIYSGTVTIETPEPIVITSPYGTVTADVSLSGDAKPPLSTLDGKLAGKSTLTVDLTEYPLPVPGEVKASVHGSVTASLAENDLVLTVAENTKLQLSDWPVASEMLPPGLVGARGPVEITVSEPVTLTTNLMPVSVDELSIQGTGRLDATSGPFTATLHGPMSVNAQDVVTLKMPRIDLDMLKGELYGKAVRSQNSIADFSADLTALTGSGVFETDTTVTDSDATLDAKLRGRFTVSQAGANLIPSPGGRIAYTAGTSAIEVELAGAESDRITVELDPQSISGKLSLATLTVNHDGTAIDLSGSAVTVRHAADTGTLTAVAPALFVNGLEMLAGPVSLNATVKQSEAGNTLDGTLTTAPGLSAQFHAFHTEKVPVIHTVTANLEVAPLTFSEGGLQPSDVFPFLILSGPIDGVLATTMAVTVDPDKPLKGLITSTIKDAGFRNPVFAIGGVNAEIRLPIETLPASQPDQTASGHVSFGPLQQAPFTLHYETGQDMTVLIDTLVIDGFGGRFGVKQVGISPGGTEATGIIFLDAVDFDVLTRVADIEGFSADGVLSGDVPFAIIGNRLIAPKGQLRALGAGHLTYTSPELDAAALSDPQMALLVEALRDFQYEALSLDLEMPADSDGSLLLNLQGNNANVLDGHPFNINVNLESDFNKLSNDLYKIYEQATDFVSASSQ